MLDADLVRVDLVKIKRKLFLSYPKGSVEREHFLLSSKLSELSYLTKLIPKEEAEIVFAEYKKALKIELFCIISINLLGLVIGAMLGVFSLVYHKGPFILWVFSPILVGLACSVPGMIRMRNLWRDIQPFKKEYNSIQEKIRKITDEFNKKSIDK